MAGGRVLPVKYDGSKTYFDKIFELINGLFLMGGS